MPLSIKQFFQEVTMTYRILTITVLFLVLLTGCVSSGKHEAALAELDTVRQSLGSAQDEISRNKQQIEKTKQALADAQEQVKKTELELATAQQQVKKTELALAVAKQEVTTTQDDVTKLEAKKLAFQMDLLASQTKLAASHKQLVDSQAQLATSQAQLATLREIEAETKRRNEIYAQFVDRLKTMIDGGQLTVSIEQGRIVINLPNNVLFKSGSANLNTESTEALTLIAAAISQFSDRRFQIEGHTDNNPIKNARFPSNWELSTARALAVVHLLTNLGVTSENISAAGFGEFHPRSTNETEEGRELNRRIEIIMLPNLDILSNELPRVAS